MVKGVSGRVFGFFGRRLGTLECSRNMQGTSIIDTMGRHGNVHHNLLSLLHMHCQEEILVGADVDDDPCVCEER